MRKYPNKVLNFAHYARLHMHMLNAKNYSNLALRVCALELTVKAKPFDKMDSTKTRPYYSTNCCNNELATKRAKVNGPLRIAFPCK